MVQNRALFNGYIAVDWSASARRGQGKNSVWIAVLGPDGQLQVQNPATRKEAINCIVMILTEAKDKGRRLLCGFDFPFGFPEGTAQTLPGQDNWEAVWETIAEEIKDCPNNWNNRFDAAAVLNGHFQGEGPFWGNGLNRDIPGLGRTTPHNRWGVDLPPYRRHVERVFPGQGVWQLNGQGAVGGQALTGIAALNRLRRRADVQVWPFETLGEGGCHVLAEIYPSLIEPWPGAEVLDMRQVQAVATRLGELDETGHLADRLHAPEDMPAAAAVQNEEGLFLDIT